MKGRRRQVRAPTSRSRTRREVALIIETSNGYARGLLNGIIAYMREHESWSVYLGEQGRGDDPPRWLRRWRGDGVIARIENARIAAAVVESGLPAVDVSAARKVAALPWVETDDRAIADAAAQHLLQRNLRQLAFCGDERFNWSRWRCDHFRRAAAVLAEVNRPALVLAHVGDDPVEEPAGVAVGGLDEQRHFLPPPAAG